MEKSVFVDGQHGTTGLQIRERLTGRSDVQLMDIPEEKRKDLNARSEYINGADIVFLCLPDDAARESVSLVKNPSVCIIDGSTAHRVTEGWTYGMPELKKGQRELIRQSKRIAVPGCHASGFILMLHPLIAGGIVAPDYPISTHTVAGYSGGGKGMIADYDNPDSPDYVRNPRPYSLKLDHKHLPEMTKYSGLTEPPVFSPTVVNVYTGEIISIPLIASHLMKKMKPRDIREYLAGYYSGEQFVRVIPYPADDYLKNGFLTFTDCNGTNNLDIFVFGNDERILLSARYDNLGKGASGAAVQNMNIVLGLPEATGL
jgi:N-acetyl-gamma-glutamyl-phosphate reductase